MDVMGNGSALSDISNESLVEVEGPDTVETREWYFKSGLYVS